MAPPSGPHSVWGIAEEGRAGVWGPRLQGACEGNVLLLPSSDHLGKAPVSCFFPSLFPSGEGSLRATRSPVLLPPITFPTPILTSGLSELFFACLRQPPRSYFYLTPTIVKVQQSWIARSVGAEEQSLLLVGSVSHLESGAWTDIIVFHPHSGPAEWAGQPWKAG